MDYLIRQRYTNKPHRLRPQQLTDLQSNSIWNSKSSSSSNNNNNSNNNHIMLGSNNNLVGVDDQIEDIETDLNDNKISSKVGFTNLANSPISNNDINFNLQSQSSPPNKRSPLSSPQTGNGLENHIISPDRLTVLEEPELPQLDYSIRNVPNKINNKSRGTKLEEQATNLLVGQHHGGSGSVEGAKRYSSQENGFDLRPEELIQRLKSSERGIGPRLNDENEGMHLFIGFSTILLILLLALLIVYNWLRWRKNGVRQNSSISHSMRLPSNCFTRKRASNSSFCRVNNEDLVRDEVRKVRNCEGERIQLVERKLANSTRADQEEDAIQVEEEIPINDQALNSGCDDRLITMVILKRRFNKSSFVVAARTTKPRVMLLTSRVRKFIDDEAEELRRKRMLDPKQPLQARALGFILNALSRTQLEGSARGEEQKVSANSDELAKTTGEGEEEAEVEQEEKELQAGAAEEVPLTVEVHRAAGSDNSETIEMVPIGGVSAADSVLQPHAGKTSSISDEANLRRSPFESNPNTAQIEAQIVGQKLSPSPIINDPYSSISACSLFSPSPIDLHNYIQQHNQQQQQLQYQHQHSQQQHQPSSPCGCSMNRIRLADMTSACSEFALKSKSQGHSPCHPLSFSQSAAYRPCCSASPSASNNVATQMEQKGCNHICQQQYKLRLLAQQAHIPASQYSSFLERKLGTYCANTDTAKCRIVPNMTASAAKCNNHIKRQYENYYDDEQEEAYRRLTASLGMELGLGFEHDGVAGAHEEASVRSLNYTSNSPTAGANLEVLSQFSRFQGCGQHSAMDGGVGACLPGQPLMRVVGNNFVQQNQLLTPLQSCKCFQKSNLLAQTCDSHLCELRAATTISMPTAQLFNNNDSQFIAPSPYLLKHSTTDGSVGELLSSGSTSLGGSDGEFAATATTNLVHGNGIKSNVCQNLLCSCQTNSATLVQAPMTMQPMSILVQQPSIGTPPPPAGSQPTSDSCSNGQFDEVKVQGAEEEKRRLIGSSAEPEASETKATNADSALNSSDEPQSRVAQAKSSSHSSRPKWRVRRRLNQRRPTQLAFIQHKECHQRATRRMSIACDRISSLSGSGVVYGGTMRDQRQLVCNAPIHNQQPNQSSPLHHRASVSSDGSWSIQQGSLVNQFRFSNSGTNNNQPSAQQLSQVPSAEQQIQPSTFHRPSDASLYELPSGAFANGKSSYSSSGGSSSGIGFSGSTCTNTPTKIFPYGSFATKADILANYQHLQADQSPAVCAHQIQFGACLAQNYNQLAQDHFSSSCQATTCPSRKFSLPVQLESQVAERLSPTMRTKLLFEKNFQRVDSPNLVNQSLRAFPGEAVAVCQQAAANQSYLDSLSIRGDEVGRTFESRRSSQTITRQSSFWLEDNSVDSVLSLTTSGPIGQLSESGSQMDMQLLQEDKVNCNQVQQQPVEQQPINCRPSSSPIVMSADSIESVKQKLPTQVDQQAQKQQESDTGNSNSKEQTHQQVPIQRQETNGSSSSDSPQSTTDSTSNSNNKLDSSSNTSAATTTKDKPTNQFHGHLAHFRQRLSSSSTASSTTSSPSPDFSRPSERILALASKSSSISKRHLFSKLRSRRYSRLSGSGANFEGGSSKRTATNSLSSVNKKSNQKDEGVSTEEESELSLLCGTTSLAKKSTSDSLEHESELDIEFRMEQPNERPTSDLNSNSLERQCRELWKLRATLHEDSCVSDNWSNYHQRLNRRHDSGYKSIENQLSSSLEGNLMHPSAGFQAASTGSATNQAAESNFLLNRPQSGCSGLNRPKPIEEEKEAKKVEVEEQVVTLVEDGEQLSVDIEQEIGNGGFKQASESSLDAIDGKLAELDLDDTALSCLLRESCDRECHSRSSKSSNEEEAKKNTSGRNWSR